MIRASIVRLLQLIVGLIVSGAIVAALLMTIAQVSPSLLYAAELTSFPARVLWRYYLTIVTLAVFFVGLPLAAVFEFFSVRSIHIYCGLFLIAWAMLSWFAEISSNTILFLIGPVCSLLVALVMWVSRFFISKLDEACSNDRDAYRRWAGSFGLAIWVVAVGWVMVDESNHHAVNYQPLGLNIE